MKGAGFFRASFVFLVVVMTAFGCSSPATNLGAGGVQGTVGLNGGTVTTGDGLTLTVPAGALGEAINITITPVSISADNYEIVGSYLFEPSGLQFQMPFTVSFPLPAGSTDGLTLFWSKLGDDSSFEVVAGTIVDGFYTAQVSHFSRGYLARATVTAPDAGTVEPADAGTVDLCAGVSCDDGNACTTDSCNSATGACVYSNNTASCDDGNACTSGDTCSGGACVAGAALSCDDSEACTDDACDTTTGCVHANNTASCDDGSVCTSGDTCTAGVCVGGTPMTCADDDNECTDEICDPVAGCIAVNNTASCDDGNACTTGDHCSAGACTGGAAVVCAAPGQCQVAGTCDPATGCPTPVPMADGSQCNDGNACTSGDHCSGGACVGGGAATCPAVDQCHNAGTCNPATGACSNTAKADGSQCDDGNACTSGEACVAGACVGGSAMTCADDGNVCTDEICDPAVGCTNVPNTVVCRVSTGPCDLAETCINTVCPGVDTKVVDGTVCTDDNTCEGTKTCQSGVCTCEVVVVAEICDNGEDDDGDGDVDCADSDCANDPNCGAPAVCYEAIQDGSFEGGTSSVVWTVDSTNGYPLLLNQPDIFYGDWFVAFGAYDVSATLPEVASVAQNVTIPVLTAGQSATLLFAYALTKFGEDPITFNGTFRVSVDADDAQCLNGTQVMSLSLADIPAQELNVANIDLSSFADGNEHRICIGASMSTAMEAIIIDMVSLTVGVNCGPVCGNGAIELGEQCDDSNTVDGDGCSSVCAVEAPAGWTCNPIYYGAGDGCDCGCGIMDADCASSTAICAWEYCDDGFMPDPADNAQCITIVVPGGWTCDSGIYSDGNCDCGCGAVDLDCSGVTDDYCDVDNCTEGFEIDPNNNANCLPPFVCADGVTEKPASYVCDQMDDCGDFSDELVASCHYCGNTRCDEDETADSCPEDCGGGSGYCGDGTCDSDSGEDSNTCCGDCGVCGYCGDGTCDSNLGEDSNTCCNDCGVCEYCGDGSCNNGESCWDCSNDCGDCPIEEYCGDGSCNNGESCYDCSGDCGPCPEE